MNCGFCHKEIPEQVGVAEAEKVCGACLGGCRKIHCPFCHYANPVPGKYLRRLLKKERDK